MSLLGKLFSGLPATGPTASRPSNPLDSNLEDQFTYNLLFPDAEALCHNEQVFPFSSSGPVFTHANSNTYDVNGDIDLDMRDVRVIIMQEATPSSGSPYLLFDSHTPPPQSPSQDRQTPNNSSALQPRSEGRRSISSPRKTSVGQISRPVVVQQEAPAPRTFGAFDRRPAHKAQPGYTETEGQRSVREYREEVSTFSNCIFGTSEVLAYKGTCTKVHILPSESKPFAGSSSYAADGSFGRSSMRSSKLVQSFTSENVGPGPPSAGLSAGPSSRAHDRKKVLITRMFPVALPNEDPEDLQNRTPMPGNTGGETTGYPFPKINDTEIPGKKPQPKQRRTPMYAVGLIVHLPASPPHAPSAPASRSSFRGPSSYNEQDSFPSSFSSTRRAGWTMLGTGFGIESLDSSFYSDVDDRIDMITQHWDIIMRTLTHLQTVATESLLCLLRQADINSPDPRRDSHSRAPSGSVSISGKRVVDEIKPFKVPKANAKLVQLTQNCLMQIQKIHKEVDAARQRVVSGIKSLQVVTGQGRWGIWREEARFAEKWAGGKDKGFFFYNLLTGFLGIHTEWLQALGPSWYRRRHYQNQRAVKDDDISLPARTIVVVNDKMAARRLIFLLAAFLPANQQIASSRGHRPSTSVSLGGYSQSPPSYVVPLLREESLRRKINKRTGTSRTPHSRTMSSPAHQPHQPHVAQPSQPGLGGLGITVPAVEQERRNAEAAQIKTSNLPIPGSDIGTRKSSTATTTTATPVTTMPHFSTRRPVRGTGPVPRPGSSGSLATDDLLRSLKRGDSSGQYSNISTDSQGQNSRWGSMISGFWGSKRRPSSATTDTSMASIEGVEIHDPYYKDITSQPRNKLEAMVEEATKGPIPTSRIQQERELRKSESGSTKTTRAAVQQDNDAETTEQIIHTAERVTHPSGAFESPVKTSITEDGVIEIDVPLPDYLAFETAVSSPSSSGYLSTPGFGNGLEGFEHYSRAGPDSDTTINVGGWLPRYHPDFALQAIPSQPDLIASVKASMKAEPTPILPSTPHAEDGNGDRWVDVSSALIADATNFTLTHLRYRRLVKIREVIEPAAPSTAALGDSRYGNVYSNALLTPTVDVFDDSFEERFIEEQLVSMDDTLIDAVERIIAQSGQVSKNSSACSSRSTSRRPGIGRERSNSDTRGIPASRLEVPRNECKRMVLSALEEIVREVAESREDTDHGRAKESFLREGVRSWLGSVESAE
ncbi:hypothetical protein ACMFMG_005413 [Clarireedia jacksonii]